MTHPTRRLRDDQEKEIETMTDFATHLFRIMGRHAPQSPQGDRQMKAQTHDFRDGNGPVPSHIHTRGGGWVADTTHVDKSAHIGPDAQVFGDARVSGNAWVYGNARVYGNAWVYDNALVGGDARVRDSARVYGGAQVYGDARVSGAAQVNRGMYTSTPTSITLSDGSTFT
jgi:tetrahydrodipicolinate N-succinyltransferase